MERGLFIGGALICGSIALALMLNLSGRQAPPQSPVPVTVADDTAIERAAARPEPAEDEDCSSRTPPAAPNSQPARKQSDC